MEAGQAKAWRKRIMDTRKKTPDPRVPIPAVPAPGHPDPKAMNRAKKALLLSGAMFPGAGQFYNGQKIKGAVFIALIIVFLAIFAYKTATGFNIYFQNALSFSELYPLDSPPERLSGGKILIEAVIFGALPALVVWILSALDAYKTGMAIDRAAKRRMNLRN